jgi:thiol-disulfide isomerase/thioredoxin
MPIYATELLMLSSALLGAQPRVLIGETGPTQIVAGSPQMLGGMRWDEYSEVAAGLTRFSVFVPLGAPLRNAGDDVRYGLNAVLPVGDVDTIRNLSWALVPQDGAAPILIVDRNADGDLSDDDPLLLGERVEGGLAAEESWPVRGLGNETEALRVRWLASDSEKGIRLSYYPLKERRGSFRLDGRDVAFALRTTLARFDSPGSLLGVDLNRDGEIAFVESDVEVFPVEGGVVGLDGNEYSLSVDRFGRRLTLTSTGRQLADRPTLAIGTKAPELEGEAGLAGFSGGPVLLEFWSPTCHGCQEMAPTLHEASRCFPGVQFVGITDAGVEAASRFTDEHQHGWPQLSGASGVDAFEVYRISVFPTYYVLDADGVILMRGHSEKWPEVEALLSDASTAHLQQESVAAR